MGSAASSTVAATSTIATPATKDDIASVADQVSPKVDSANSPATITKGDKKLSCKKHKHNVSKKKDRLKKHKKNTKRKNVKEESSSEDDTTSESDASTSESEESESAESTPETSETDSESEKQKRKHKKSKHSKKNRRRRRGHRDEDDSDSDSSTSSEEDAIANRKALKRLKKRKAKKIAKKLLSDDEDEEEEVDSEDIEVRRRVANLRLKQAGSRRLQKLKEESGKKGKTKRASKVAFKRVDELWDSTIHNYKLRETLDDPDADEFDQYIFTVRRKFDWENKYMETVVDIKSKPLREALSTVMEGVKAVSLVTDKPIVDPNMLFLYLEEARAHMKELKKLVKTEKKKKARKLAAMKAAHLKVLIKYLDTDYAETKKTLYPLLDSNMITFDLLWALFKPNTIAYTPTYGHADEPRAFKIEYATKESSFMKGTWYVIEGKYLEYDGKTFGMGNMAADVESFKGARKITSLACYPLKYRRDADDVKTKLIERGKKFVALRGMNYRFHKGMAFFKKKRSVIKVNINGRVMIDPALHRRINPNYAISTVRPKDPDMLDSDSEEGSDDCCCCASSSEDDHANGNDDSEPPRPRYKFVRDKQGKAHIIEVEIDENGNEIPPKEDFDKLEKDKEGSMEEPELEFTEEELLIASPVVLGFAFGEKLWLEFSVSGVNEIEWNDGAFDSLVLPDNQKSIVKALVESHTFHAAENIDDVIQGKGKGLVAVLHGPPGTGKTLTAEGIAELLKRPLYMVSAGELGTDSRSLEGELNKILDIAHSWGAVLLLDEADVFLEKRTIQDIHRNALVSIFLRLLEYFQGILFLTTNRVETFDDAFQSRIHIALRYGDLTLKAKRSVWKMFLDKVKSIDGVQTSEFTDKDLDVLARHNLNGRQIKNSVRTAQALAVNEKSALSMSHIKRVLEVAETFEQDLKGGTGYMDAMRSYT
ncbi:hypothetical protein BGW36DRAFT_286699 [Talaromyces proteolyticus]|uniref:AAA+ ATPase domain-containing protein n=1 Tax=Talaromyces proteolyticus TaxID=1131652 RepID=A0AAD4L8R3_9EURO|nr:uncharacterized protein BGW36DRAFT_286699 [Talaromyces proteolyticus]KAH8705964.1 hypothetical protein BGW36DRAFT_286699 [Talaromyces proteolyticus]